jgi:hypothetical protein
MCSLCSAIPDRLTVDTMHDPELFPDAVARFALIGGTVCDREVRRCPECGTYFAYTRDHDNQSGVGYGYTDETIERLWALDARDDGTWSLRSVAPRVTGDMLAIVIRDLKARGRPPLERITTLAVTGGAIAAAPDELGWLTGLEVLSLRDCGVTSLPPSIGALQRLSFVFIAGNPLRELPVEILRLPLAQVELQGTHIETLPDAFLASSIRFRNYEANAVPEAWRAAYLCEPAYRETLRWFIDRGAQCRDFSSGAWNHEDRFELSLSLPASAVPAGMSFLPAGSPFRVVARGGHALSLEADGRAGADRIDVDLSE